jgi:hypothetical protein
MFSHLLVATTLPESLLIRSAVYEILNTLENPPPVSHVALPSQQMATWAV